MAFDPRIVNGNIVKAWDGTIFQVEGVDYGCSGGSCGSYPLYYGKTFTEAYAQSQSPVKMAEDWPDYLRDAMYL